MCAQIDFDGIKKINKKSYVACWTGMKERFTVFWSFQFFGHFVLSYAISRRAP